MTPSESADSSGDDDIAAELKAGLSPGADEAADISAFLDHPLTLIDQMPTPFLQRYGVYRVMPRHLSRPILRHVAGGPGLPTLILGADAADLAAVLREDGSSLAEPDDAVAYASVLLELVSGRPGLMRVVSSVDDIPFKDDLAGADLEKRQAAESSLRDRVGPADASRTDDGWSVSLWVARDGALHREVLRLTAGGDLLGQEVAESHDLPLITVA